MTLPRRPRVRFRSYALAFVVSALFLILAHGPLLHLPFFWDEAGQFIPASLDLFKTGAWIPISTLPNVHPPGVMAYLALFWEIFGYSIEGTRVAMLLVAATGVVATFLLAIELSRGATGAPAFAALPLLCLSPLFFAQAMLAQLDMPAMCLTIAALLLFLQGHFRSAALTCVVLVLVKETGAAVPALFLVWLLYERRFKDAAWFVAPFPILGLWLLALHHATGSWLGNPEFAAYNLKYPLNPARFGLALLRRTYYLFVGSGHFIGTAVLIWAMRRMPLFKARAWNVAGSLVIAHIFVVSLLGGAVLERYLLPVLPIVYIAFAVSLRSLLPRYRMLALGGLIALLIAANFINPVYPFPFENNLAFVNFLQLEQDATAAAEARGAAPVATVFPISDGLLKPELGFVNAAVPVIEMENFGAAEIEKLRHKDPAVVLVYQRAWDPLKFLLQPAARDFMAKHYGYVPDLPPGTIAHSLGMHVSQRWERRGLSMQMLERGEERGPMTYAEFH
jgi:hypothetical protein